MKTQDFCEIRILQQKNMVIFKDMLQWVNKSAQLINAKIYKFDLKSLFNSIYSSTMKSKNKLNWKLNEKSNRFVKNNKTKARKQKLLFERPRKILIEFFFMNDLTIKNW